MYVVLEYLAYVALIAGLSALLFAATTLVLVTRAGARRLTEISHRVAAYAIKTAAGKLYAGKSLQRGTPQHTK
jgi:hypothetical protein